MQTGESEEAGEETRLSEQEVTARLEGLGTRIKELRDEAVKARESSGIESAWLEDEEYYQGIDEYNREEHKLKPTSPDGRVIIEQKAAANKEKRSTVFVKLTRPYVDAAAARVSDMLLPTDDRNWDIRPTPIPDLIGQLKDKTPVMDESGNQVMQPELDENGEPKQGPTMMGGQPMMGPDGNPMVGPVSRPMTTADLAKKAIQEAKDSAEKARDRMDDWLVQCQYHAQVRLVIEDAARIGTGILKGPCPQSIRRRAVVRAMEGVGIIIKDEILPCSRVVNPWNFYPDPSCGENIQKGKFVFERDDISARILSELKRDPTYLKDKIDQILKDGPKDRHGNSKRPRENKANEKEQFEIWYFHGYLDSEDLEAAGCECGDEEQYPAIVVMVNDTVIKAMLEPLDSGEFPYDVMIWQRRPGHWAGIGVSRQMRTSQDGVNAGTRNLMDNAGLSSGPVLIIDRSKIEPADGSGNFRLGPRTVFVTTDDFEGSVKDAITWVNITCLQQELMAIISFWMQRAEDETGLPMLLQGQQGKAPDTVGGMTMLQNNASSVLRRIARTFDDRITEPHIGRYYEWLLLHGEDDAEKGDFQIDARGSSALVERDMQTQALIQTLGASANPVYGLDPEKTMQEVLKSQRLDPKRLELDEAKKKAMQQNHPQDPRIVVKGMELQARDKELQATQAFEKHQADMEFAFREWEKKLDATLEAAKLDGDKNMNDDTLKTALARETMKLRAQIRLAMSDTYRSAQVATPSFEPPGRATPGRAFQE